MASEEDQGPPDINKPFQNWIDNQIQIREAAIALITSIVYGEVNDTVEVVRDIQTKRLAPGIALYLSQTIADSFEATQNLSGYPASTQVKNFALSVNEEISELEIKKRDKFTDKTKKVDKMANPNKRKGSSWEKAVADYLQLCGFTGVERRAQEGSNDRGDIAGIDGWVLEAKNERRIELAQYMEEAKREAANADARFYAAVVKRRRKPVNEAYVVMPLSVFADVLNEMKK